MRVACLVEEFPVLSETFILSQLTGLMDRGVEVDVYAWGRRSASEAHPDAIKHGLMDQVRYATAMPRGRMARYASALRLIAGHPSRASLSAINPLQHGRQALTMRLIHDASAVLHQPRYDVIHAHFGQVGARATRIRRLGLLRGPLLVTFYGFDISQRPRMEKPGFYRPLFADAARVLALSEVMRGQLIALGCPAEKVMVHHLGADAKRFAYRPRQRLAGEPTRIISVARLAEKKGLEYGIRAVAQVVREQREVRYTIIGDGPMRPELEKLIRELGVSEQVTLAGWKRQDEVAAMLDTSHVLLAPSVTAVGGDQEGTPTVIAEAMLMGLPVLSTLHSGIPEMVRDGVSGWLTPERDVDRLADRLRWLTDHPDQWTPMGQAGRRDALEQFDIDALNARLAAMYEQVIGR
ncbi:MAG: glycosyltransferase [Phycisphaeraceae bacterium]|nr:glycosyltransferase [Phycisphaeraceae bacterium]